MTLMHIFTIAIFLGFGVMGMMAVLDAFIKMKSAVNLHTTSGFASAPYEGNSLRHIPEVN